MENMALSNYLETGEGLGESQRRNKLRGLVNTYGKVIGNKKVERNFYLTEGLSAGPSGRAV